MLTTFNIIHKLPVHTFAKISEVSLLVLRPWAQQTEWGPLAEIIFTIFSIQLTFAGQGIQAEKWQHLLHSST